MFHKVTIIGHVGGEPESRFLPSGTNVCSFSLASNRKWTNSDGTPGEETIWWRISAWGKLGEVCQQYVHKGRQIFIEGEMVPDRENGGPRVWTDQSGQPRASFEVRATSMKLLGSRDDVGDGGYASEEAPRQSAPARSNTAPARQAAQTTRQSTPAASGGNRRSTMSAPQPPANDDFGDFGPDDIPF